MLRPVLLAVVGFALAPAFAADDDKLTPTKEEQAALDVTNKEREAAKLPPLKFHPTLYKAAREHSENMAKQNKLEHSLDGVTYVDRMLAMKYPGKGFGENIACGYPKMSAKEAVAEWMSSPPHKENLLKESFGEVGIARAVAKDGTVYWTQVFGKPK
jgi:uncharacterized protein YkwD